MRRLAAAVVALVTLAALIALRGVVSGHPDGRQRTGVATETTNDVTVTPPGSPTSAPTSHAEPDVVTRLRVAPEDPSVTYDRDEWPHWTSRPDVGRGCDQREVVLRTTGTGWGDAPGCAVTCPTGRCWTSTYDGVTLGVPSAVQVDHVVPLKEAERSGADDWDAPTRRWFANDPANLRVASARVNASKGDRDPGRWHPPLRASWCDYATAYVRVKITYELAVDPAERVGLVAMLATC